MLWKRGTFQVTKTTASISVLIFSQASSPTSKSSRTEILWITPRNQTVTSAIVTCPSKQDTAVGHILNRHGGSVAERIAATMMCFPKASQESSFLVLWSREP